MDYLGDYWTYCSRYEILRNYSFWTAIGVGGAVLNRQVYFLIGDIEVHGNMYILIIGPQGNKKSTPNDFARGLFEKARPNLNIGASNQSAEDIVKTMADKDFVRSFTNHRGEPEEVRPYAFFINEFKDFIAYNPLRMLNFLGNIYDRKAFDASTIKRGMEKIINPSINIVACENPEQLSKLMKNDIVTGGMSRRFVMVYETGYAEPKPRIVIDSDARAAIERVEARLKDACSVTGEFKWTESGRKFYDPWYIKNSKKMEMTTNPIMKGYLSTKNVQLFKVAMILDSLSDKPMLQMTEELLDISLALLDAIEGNMPKLSLAAGRNELVAGQQKILEILRVNDGWYPLKLLKKEVETELSPTETWSTLKHLEETDQIMKKTFAIPNDKGIKVEREMILLPKTYWDKVEKGEIKPTSNSTPLERPTPPK